MLSEAVAAPVAVVALRRAVVVAVRKGFEGELLAATRTRVFEKPAPLQPEPSLWHLWMRHWSLMCREVGH